MPFLFEKLHVYKKLLMFIECILTYLKHNKIEPELKDQLKRACLSIPTNIAEGSGRFTKRDKKNFYVISRGSIYECVALIQIIKKVHNVSKSDYDGFLNQLEELSKMINGLIISLQ